MKKGKKVLSAILGLSVAVGMFPAVGVSAAGSLKSDTTAPFSVAMGKNYTFKITAAGTTKKPVVTVANGRALKVFLKGQSGNNYYYTVTAVGQAGSTSGVYMALPGQAAIRCCIVTVGTPSSGPQTINLSSLSYVTQQGDSDDIGYEYANEVWYGNESQKTDNAGTVYTEGLIAKAFNCNGAFSNGDYSVYRDYLLNGGYKKLTGKFALSQHSRNYASVEWTLNVYGDGKLLYSSDPAAADVLPQDVCVDVSGVKMLRIESTLSTTDWDETYTYAGLYNSKLTK